MSAGTVCQIVVVPALLVLVGYLILRWADGQWWGVALWILLSPVVYLLVDAVVFGDAQRALAADAKRQRSAISSQRAARRDPAKVPPASDWDSAQDVSTGAEILRRGRRYDRRRA